MDTSKVGVFGLGDPRCPVPFLPGHGGCPLLQARSGRLLAQPDFRDDVCRNPVGDGSLLKVCGITGVVSESFDQGAEGDGEYPQAY